MASGGVRDNWAHDVHTGGKATDIVDMVTSLPVYLSPPTNSPAKENTDTGGESH